MSVVTHCTAASEISDLICHVALETPQNRIAIQYHDETPDGIQQYVNARLAYEFTFANSTPPLFDHGTCFTTCADPESLVSLASRAVLGVYYESGIPRPLVSSPRDRGLQQFIERSVERFCTFVVQVWSLGVASEAQMQ